MQVTPEALSEVARRTASWCGVQLDATKGYLIEGRLGPLLKEAGAADFIALCRLAERESRWRSKFVDAITTGETYFFRDESPFEALQFRVLPDLIDGIRGQDRPRRLRFWSAACSSGQEVYSLAIALAETLPRLSEWDVEILATDVSEDAVARASAGQYSEYEVRRGLTEALRNRYFQPDGRKWCVRDTLRKLVRFQRRNLLESISDLGPFDVIFCRNVAIYFASDVQDDLFRRLARQLTESGVLFVGVTESLVHLGPAWAPHRHCRGTYYQPRLVM